MIDIDKVKFVEKGIGASCSAEAYGKVLMLLYDKESHTKNI